MAPTDVATAFRGVGIEPEPLRQRVTGWLLRHGIVVALVAEMMFFAAVGEVPDDLEHRAGPRADGRRRRSSPSRSACCCSAGTSTSPSDRPPGWPARSWACTSRASGGNAVVGVLIAIGVGAVVGVAQGVLATKLTLSPIIITLGFYTAVRGPRLRRQRRRREEPLRAGLRGIGRWHVPGTKIAMPVVHRRRAAAPRLVVPHRTRSGAVTSSASASTPRRRTAGRHQPQPAAVARSTSLTGACAGIAAIISASRLDAAPPTLGEGLEIDVLSAVLLGGVAFGGGKGSIVGVAAGVLFIGFLNNGLLLLGAPPFWLRVSSGRGPRRRRGAGGDPAATSSGGGRGRRVERAPADDRRAAVASSAPVLDPGRHRDRAARPDPARADRARRRGSTSASSKQHFGVSHIPIREAIRRLEAEGLVVNVPKRGAVAAGVSLNELDDIYDLRRIIEPPVLRRAVGSMADAELDDITAAYDALDRRRAATPAEIEFSDRPLGLPLERARAGSTDEIERLLRRLWRVADRYVRLARRPRHQRRPRPAPPALRRVRQPTTPRRRRHPASATSTSPATRCAASSHQQGSNDVGRPRHAEFPTRRSPHDVSRQR